MSLPPGSLRLERREHEGGGWHAVGGRDGEEGVLRARGTQPEWRWKGQGAQAGGARESAEVSQANGGGEGVGAC